MGNKYCAVLMALLLTFQTAIFAATEPSATALAVNHLDLQNKFTLVERFEQKPGIATDVSQVSDVGTALAIMAKANRNFMLAGTNAVTGCGAFVAGGGVALTTTTSSNDQVLLCPHSTAGQSQWTTAGLWTSSNALRFETKIKTGSSIAAATLFAGLKKTNTPVVATDDDQVYFRYEPSEIGGRWKLVISRAGTDEEYDTGVTVAASTEYVLEIDTDSNRKVAAFINGKCVYQRSQGSALTASVSLYPFLGVQTTTTAAKVVEVRYVLCSRAN